MTLLSDFCMKSLFGGEIKNLFYKDSLKIKFFNELPFVIRSSFNKKLSKRTTVRIRFLDDF